VIEYFIAFQACQQIASDLLRNTLGGQRDWRAGRVRINYYDYARLLKPKAAALEVQALLLPEEEVAHP
jgi:hypothetical protein